MKYAEKVKSGRADRGGPPSHHAQWSCRRKRFYLSLDIAEQKAQEARIRTEDQNIVAYKCDFCIGYHIGHAARP